VHPVDHKFGYSFTVLSLLVASSTISKHVMAYDIPGYAKNRSSFDTFSFTYGCEYKAPTIAVRLPQQVPYITMSFNFDYSVPPLPANSGEDMGAIDDPNSVANYGTTVPNVGNFGSFNMQRGYAWAST
jgi:hypothetical protein